MMHFSGRGVCGAIAIGRVSVLRRGALRVERYPIGDVEAELRRLDAARARADAQLWAIEQRTQKELGDAEAQIFAVHAMMLEDEDLNDAIRSMIRGQHVNAEYAVSSAGEHFYELFAAAEDSYMQARAEDIKDVTHRWLRCFGEERAEDMATARETVICADDLSPGETALLDRERVVAFVTEQGTQNSHTAILARNLGIPAVVGVGSGFLASLRDGWTVAVDGYSGEVTVSPDEVTLGELRARQQEDLEKKSLLQRLRGKENVTRDGRRIRIYANIGDVDQIGAVLLNDAGGVGLLRSEFLYLERGECPSEEELFSIYRRALESMGEKRVIIRTLDIGADKQVDYLELPREENPALGLRAVRLYLLRPELFRTQMRALYRASVYGRLGVMFPMIVSEWELEELLGICRRIRNELREEGVPVSEEIEHGIMIETPAAAIISDRLAPMVDFFSIGTNDLTQYTLACDRQNPQLERFCDPHHEALLRLINYTVQSAHRHGVWVGICGELAADTALTERFLRMGVDELSVSPVSVLRLRDVVRGLDLSGAERG